jgi:hypothetical protein
MSTKKAQAKKAAPKERRTGADRRKDDRRDTARDADKGILSTRKEERRQGGRRKEDKTSE